jgi:hypothetical protein
MTSNVRLSMLGEQGVPFMRNRQPFASLTLPHTTLALTRVHLCAARFYQTTVRYTPRRPTRPHGDVLWIVARVCVCVCD